MFVTSNSLTTTKGLSLAAFRHDRQYAHNVPLCRVRLTHYKRRRNAFCMYCWAACQCQQYENCQCQQYENCQCQQYETANANNMKTLTVEQHCFYGEFMWPATLKRLHIKCPIFLSDFSQIWCFTTDFHKAPSNKFQWNPSSESRADICGQTQTVRQMGVRRDGHGETNMRFSRLCVGV